MRLDKLLADAGFGSRKEVKALLKDGHVLVDGHKASQGKMQVDPNQMAIEVNGQTLDYREEIYLMMNKAPGVLTATRDRQQETVLDQIDPADRRKNLFPVGRLDKDTTGLLLLTTDGQMGHRLLSPKWHVDKGYEAVVKGPLPSDVIQQFEKGLPIDGGEICRPARLELSESPDYRPYQIVHVWLTEGKYHQVKRMFQAVGSEVLALKRLSMGPLELDATLSSGEYRQLSEKELQELRQCLV